MDIIEEIVCPCHTKSSVPEGGLEGPLEAKDQFSGELLSMITVRAPSGDLRQQLDATFDAQEERA